MLFYLGLGAWVNAGKRTLTAKDANSQGRVKPQIYADRRRSRKGMNPENRRFSCSPTLSVVCRHAIDGITRGMITQLVWTVLFDGGHLNNEPRRRRADDNYRYSCCNDAIRKDRLEVASNKDVDTMRDEPVANCYEKPSCQKTSHARPPSSRRSRRVWMPGHSVMIAWAPLIFVHPSGFTMAEIGRLASYVAHEIGAERDVAKL